MPTRNPGGLWRQWLEALRFQQPGVSGLVVDSCSDDGTNFDSLPTGSRCIQIPLSSFNHGGTRNRSLQHLPPATDVVVFMTQDALLADAQALQKLVSAFDDPTVACAFGRQLPHEDASALAAHARIFNYPDASRVVSLADKGRLGLKTCFLSNSFAAYRVADLLAVGGFPSKVILGEDMSVAACLLLAGKRVAYQADACVYHSHNYTPLEDFRRHFDTGVFHAREQWLLDAFGGASGEGLRFVKSELRYLLKHAPWLIPNALLRTVLKLLGYRLGRAEARLPLGLKRRLSMFSGFWS
ncbi:MAG: glycosyltransferase [Hydrogenophaga sp.]|nr:glycosyltransferase [Hydrogenophaga sp.]